MDGDLVCEWDVFHVRCTMTEDQDSGLGEWVVCVSQCAAELGEREGRVTGICFSVRPQNCKAARQAES
jgi:hypothetical protein